MEGGRSNCITPFHLARQAPWSVERVDGAARAGVPSCRWGRHGLRYPSTARRRLAAPQVKTRLVWGGSAEALMAAVTGRLCRTTTPGEESYSNELRVAGR